MSGAHVFTAMALKDVGKAMRWTVMSIPSGYRHYVTRAGTRHYGRKSAETEPAVPAASTAAEAFEAATCEETAILKHLCTVTCEEIAQLQ